jgi:hypothetical protein
MHSDWTRFLGISQVLGGLLTLGGYVTFAVFQPGILVAWQHALGGVVGVGSVLAGLQLLRGQRIGYTLSLANQLLQVASFTVVPYARLVSLAGLRFALGFGQEGLHLRLGGGGEFIVLPFARDATQSAVGATLEIGTRFKLESLRQSDVSLSVNFVAAYFVVLLLLARRDAAPD